MFGDMSERSLSQVMRQSSDWVGSSSQRIHPLGSWRVFSDGMLAEIGVHLERVFREFVAIVGNELREHVWIQICWNFVFRDFRSFAQLRFGAWDMGVSENKGYLI